jgi:hypothetical protein
MVQAYARGYLGSLEEIRSAVRRSSVGLHDYQPMGSADEWDGAYERLRRIMDAAAHLDAEGARLE